MYIVIHTEYSLQPTYLGIYSVQPTPKAKATMSATNSIKISNGGLQTFTDHTGVEKLIIRGVLDDASLDHLQVADYQREIGSPTRLSVLAKALETSTVPDIELGMRGSRIRNCENGSTFYLQDDVFIIDGLQRVSAGRLLMQRNPNAKPQIGCAVHLDTTYDWERERFRILNQDRARLSVNVLIRNAIPDHDSIEMLKGLCDDPSFPLKGRVCWSQKMNRGQLMTAILYVKTVSRLHARFGPGKSSGIAEILPNLDKIMATTGRHIMRQNALTFFQLIDRCFGIQKIIFSAGAPQIKSGFLFCLAELFVRCDTFWEGQRLVIPKELEQKLRTFQIHDSEVSRLAGSTGQAVTLLLVLLVDHMNRGKRTKRLVVSGLNAEPSSAVDEED